MKVYKNKELEKTFGDLGKLVQEQSDLLMEVWGSTTHIPADPETNKTKAKKLEKEIQELISKAIDGMSEIPETATMIIDCGGYWKSPYERLIEINLQSQAWSKNIRKSLGMPEYKLISRV